MTTPNAWADKEAIARASFKEVLDSDIHEDGKAQRLLTAMAFLTAAAAFIFGQLQGESTSLAFPGLISIGFVPLAFFLYMAAMVAGTLFILAALGPVFNIPGLWQVGEAQRYPRSLLFSKMITEDTRDSWLNHWKETSPEDLQAELVGNYVFEAYLLSQKVTYKVANMKFGKFLYKVALGFLGLLIIPAFTTNEGTVYNFSAWMLCGVILQDLLERATSPPLWWGEWKKRKRKLLSPGLYLTIVQIGSSSYLFTNGFLIYF